MKITVDTNFLISATQWDYSVASKLLKELLRRSIEIFSTKAIIEEFFEILQRDFNYSPQEAEKIIEKIILSVTLVKPLRKLQVVRDDPDDNIIIECAVESNSNYILTYDNHLLSLNEFEGIKIIKPEEFLKILDRSEIEPT